MKAVTLRSTFMALVFWLGINPSISQEAKVANPDDVVSIDSIIGALYEVVSGPKEERRNWDRMSSLFVDGGKLIPAGANGYRMMTVDDYKIRGDKNFSQVDFFEIENSRIIEKFGHIAHVYSTYESRRNPSDLKPFQRGINSIQLYYDGSRWWIMTVFWQAETEEFPLPAKYLK
ncbi:MAG: hypothetical protein ACKVIX_04510 [Sphingomonadales bacterium]